LGVRNGRPHHRLGGEQGGDVGVGRRVGQELGDPFGLQQGVIDGGDQQRCAQGGEGLGHALAR
jgi:hypothetical protein